MDSSGLELLLRRYHSDGDRGAREQAIVAALPHVRRLAKRFGNRGVPPEDLIQIGMIGAIKAVDRFQLERGVAVSTYLTPLVIGEIKRYFRDRGWDVRVARSLQELALRLPKATERLGAQLGRPPTITELAEAINTEPELVLEALEAAHAYSAQSLNTPAGSESDGDELIERLGATDTGYDRSETRAQLKKAIRELDAREQHVILLRYASGLTQSQVASQIGCSQMHISRIERHALTKLRAAIDTPVESAA